MLDALLAEARLRWGLDPAAGLQVVASERLIATPLEPSRPALIVPLAVLRADDERDPPAPLPGRHGPLRRRAAGRPGTALSVDACGRPVRQGRRRHDRGPRARRLPRADLPGAGAAELAVASPWAMPWVSWRLRAPDGCPWDREQTHESLRNHLLEEAYEVYDALGPRPGLAGARRRAR